MVYAYPNTYTVGITSLGYQLVWSYFAMSPRTNVRRLFTDAHEPLPASPHLFGFSFSWVRAVSRISVCVIRAQRSGAQSS